LAYYALDLLFSSGRSSKVEFDTQKEYHSIIVLEGEECTRIAGGFLAVEIFYFMASNGMRQADIIVRKSPMDRHS